MEDKIETMIVDSSTITRWDSFSISISPDGKPYILISLFMNDDSEEPFHAEFDLDACKHLVDGLTDALATLKVKEGCMH